MLNWKRRSSQNEYVILQDKVSTPGWKFQKSPRTYKSLTNLFPSQKTPLFYLLNFKNAHFLKWLEYFLISIRTLQFSLALTLDQMSTNNIPLILWLNKRGGLGKINTWESRTFVANTVRTSKAINPEAINLNSCQLLLLMCTNQLYMEY